MTTPKIPKKIAKHCWMVGANLERANLAGRNLRGINFTNANLRGADLSNADLRDAKFVRADLSRACLYNINAEGADFSGADMSMSYGRAANFSHARMWFCALRRVTYKNAFFLGTDMRGTDFVDAFLLGARFGPPNANLEYAKNLEHARFVWYLNPDGGAPSYTQKPGYIEVDISLLGGLSIQENIGGRHINKE
jgi:uncharacterized protein YjbI with pentapeptide repeats